MVQGFRGYGFRSLGGLGFRGLGFRVQAGGGGEVLEVLGFAYASLGSIVSLPNLKLFPTTPLLNPWATFMDMKYVSQEDSSVG